MAVEFLTSKVDDALAAQNPGSAGQYAPMSGAIPSAATGPGAVQGQGPAPGGAPAVPITGSAAPETAKQGRWGRMMEETGMRKKVPDENCAISSDWYFIRHVGYNDIEV